MYQGAQHLENLRIDVGIDIGKACHWIALCDESGKPIGKPMSFAEDRHGYLKMKRILDGHSLAIRYR